MEKSKNASSVDWNEKTEAQLIEAYSGRADNDKLGKIGEKFGGRNAAQIRGKLVALKVYEANEPKPASGSSQTRKADIRRAIETITGVGRDSLETLDKASKADLDKLSKALIALSDTKAADQESE